LEEKSEKDIRLLTKNLNNINLINSWLIQCGIREGKQLSKRFSSVKPNIIFGGKNNYKDLTTSKITKEQYKENRLLPINIQGEYLQKGNRSFKLDIINNNSIIFKLSKNEHIILELPSLRNNIRKELYKLESLNNNIKQGQKGYNYSVKLDKKFIYISYEEFKEDNNIIYNKDRYIGIDLNPDTIGISVKENDKILYTREYSLKPIFNKIINNNLSSNDNKSKYLQNKLMFETYEISKNIADLTKYYLCKTVFIEDLKFKQKVSNKYNKVGNRKNKNLWKRESFIHNLEKRLNIYNIDLKKINPCYSSVIGNMIYNYTDSINASLEIGRRGYEYYINKEKEKFYPIFDKELLKHQWKEMANNLNSWVEFFKTIKNSKLRYRVSLEEATTLRDHSVYRLNNNDKSYIFLYNFL